METKDNKAMRGSDVKKAVGLLIFIFVLYFPAFLINLGLSPFILDEATRANVSMEMIFRGNFIVPTINGEFYYNKPPLFNWVLILFTRITGSYSEFSFRLPVVVSIFFFAWSVYSTMKKEMGRRAALLTALAIATCGRILFYDSLKGLIDISFSWIIYLMFWSVIYYHKQKDYLPLFVLSWFLTTLAFLMKGLPALAFQGITLLSVFILRKDFRKLLSISHLAGIAVFILLTGSYFLAYNSYNPLSNYFEALVSESTKRTFLENSMFSSISHLFTFPFEFLYHFLPWSLFIIILFRRGNWRWLWDQEYSRSLIVVFGANIIVYWLSPAIYARYLFMFLPLFFGLLFHSYYNFTPSIKSVLPKVVKISIYAIACAMLLLIISFPGFIDLSIYPFFLLKYIIVLCLMGTVFYYFFRLKAEWPFVMVSFLLISRIAFNLFVVPHRIHTGTDEYQKNGARVAAELSQGHELYLLGNTRIQHVSTYYISREREEVLKRWELEPEPGVLYIREENEAVKNREYNKIFTFETRLDNLKLSLVELR